MMSGVSRWIVPVVGVLLILVGSVWTLQGISVLPGSFMTGSRLWTVNGVIAFVVGLGLVWLALRVRRSSR